MYHVVPIGAEFRGKGHEALSAQLNAFEQQGWELVLVFPVVVSGCLGTKSQTNYAVLRRRDT